MKVSAFYEITAELQCKRLSLKKFFCTRHKHPKPPLMYGCMLFIDHNVSYEIQIIQQNMTVYKVYIIMWRTKKNLALGVLVLTGSEIP